MKVSLKKTLLVLVVAGGALMGYVLWLTSCPVEIVAVHENNNHSYVLVKKLPFTDRGKINWWLEKKMCLKIRIKFLNLTQMVSLLLSFGILVRVIKKEGKYDRLCFDDMKPPINCIEKDKVFTVSNGRNMGLSFTTNNEIYRIKKSGKIVKDESD